MRKAAIRRALPIGRQRPLNAGSRTADPSITVVHPARAAVVAIRRWPPGAVMSRPPAPGEQASAVWYPRLLEELPWPTTIATPNRDLVAEQSMVHGRSQRLPAVPVPLEDNLASGRTSSLSGRRGAAGPFAGRARQPLRQFQPRAGEAGASPSRSILRRARSTGDSAG